MEWKSVTIDKGTYDEIEGFRMILGFHSVSHFVQEATRKYIGWAYREMSRRKSKLVEEAMNEEVFRG